jgi:hypothetical protein
MARYTHDERAEHIRSLTARYIAAEFPFSDDVMRASLFAIGLRGDDLREAMREAQEKKAAEPKQSRRIL